MAEYDYLEISHDFRKITIPSSKQLLGVTSDENVNVIHFRCPRYYGDIDLNNFIFRINYLNANNEGDQYLVTDKEIDGDNLTFSWTAGRHACEYSGNVKFIVCAFVSNNGVISQEYNTAIHTMQVIQGLETGEDIVEENYDIIADLLERTVTLINLQELEERMQTATEAVEGVQERIYTLTFAAANWTGSSSPYSQVITIPSYPVTSATKVDLTADESTLELMRQQAVGGIYVVNDNGTLTAYADGYKPTSALTVQAAVYEIRTTT